MPNIISRKVTCKLLDAVDEGILDIKLVLAMCLTYMSEDEVKEMCIANDIINCIDSEYIEEDEEEDFS